MKTIILIAFLFIQGVFFITTTNIKWTKSTSIHYIMNRRINNMFLGIINFSELRDILSIYKTDFTYTLNDNFEFVPVSKVNGIDTINTILIYYKNEKIETLSESDILKIKSLMQL